MAEWFKAHAWKACVCKKYRGFESLSLRHFHTQGLTNRNPKVSNYPLLFEDIGIIACVASGIWQNIHARRMIRLWIRRGAMGNDIQQPDAMPLIAFSDLIPIAGA